MRAGCLSYERFCEEAELLQKRSHELASGQEVREDKSIATWEWRHGNRQHLDGDSYLVSIGNARRYQMEVTDASAKPGNDEDLTGDINELLLAEEEAWTDEEETQTTLASSQDVQTALLEFHIVYHTIYQTPVLYFRAFAVDGRPLPSSAVTRDVQLPGSNTRSTFVAMEEHPVLGTPFSFLHPCETAEAMQLLQAQVRPSVSAEEQVPRYLASWLSLVQPLTGISPLGYYPG